MAVMGQPVPQGRGHLRVTEHRRPFREAQVGGDDETGLHIEPANRMEEKRTTGLAEPDDGVMVLTVTGPVSRGNSGDSIPITLKTAHLQCAKRIMAI